MRAFLLYIGKLSIPKTSPVNKLLEQFLYFNFRWNICFKPLYLVGIDIRLMVMLNTER